MLEQIGRAPFARHCERGRGSETAVREGCQIFRADEVDRVTSEVGRVVAIQSLER